MVFLFIFLWFIYIDYFVIDENYRYNERIIGYMKLYKYNIGLSFGVFIY